MKKFIVSQEEEEEEEKEEEGADLRRAHMKLKCGNKYIREERI